jgi:2-octaprenyl-6-methoxyphenol hydroxylase
MVMPKEIIMADHDIIISGAGYIGLATAVSIKQAAPYLDILVIDAAPEGVWKNDTRASAVAAAAGACWASLAFGTP